MPYLLRQLLSYPQYLFLPYLQPPFLLALEVSSPLYLLLYYIYIYIFSLFFHGFSVCLVFFLIGSLPTAPSQFEVGNNSTTIQDPVNEVAAFFAHFDQPEVNDLGPADFWGSGPSYADFHDFRVPEDRVSHLVMVHSNHGDFMQGFCLGHSAREHFLKMLGSVMNDIEYNFVDTVSTERILRWRAAI